MGKKKGRGVISEGNDVSPERASKKKTKFGQEKPPPTNPRRPPNFSGGNVREASNSGANDPPSHCEMGVAEKPWFPPKW